MYYSYGCKFSNLKIYLFTTHLRCVLCIPRVLKFKAVLNLQIFSIHLLRSTDQTHVIKKEGMFGVYDPKLLE